MNYQMIQWACDADMYNREVKAKLIPTRSLFEDVNELCMWYEVNKLIENAYVQADYPSDTR